MFSNKDWYILWSIPPWGRDEETDKWGFIKPKFGLQILKGRPCPTRWLWDWILDLGWIYIFKRATE